MKLRYRRVSYGSVSATSRQMERMLDYLWDTSRAATMGLRGEWRPPVDVYQTGDAVAIVMEIAGMNEEDIEVVLFDDVIVVTGERKPLREVDEDLTYHEAGVRYGRFRAEVLLPAPVDAENTQAVYENGFLSVRLPKRVTRMGQ